MKKLSEMNRSDIKELVARLSNKDQYWISFSHSRLTKIFNYMKDTSFSNDDFNRVI